MGLIKNSVTDFSKGLINTRLDVPGSLIRAEDCNYGLGGVRQRGPITKVSTIYTGATTTYQKTCGLGFNNSDVSTGIATYINSLTTAARVFNSVDAGATWTDSGGSVVYSDARGASALYSGAQVVPLGDELIIGGTVESNWYQIATYGGGEGVFRYGGSTMSNTNYVTGEATTTSGSNVVNGSNGAAWTSDMVGAYFICGSNNRRWQRIRAVISTTQLILDGTAPAVVTATGVPGANNYTISKYGPVSTEMSGPAFATGSVRWAYSAGSSPRVVARCIGVHQNRLFMGGLVQNKTNTTNTGNVAMGSAIRWTALLGEDSANDANPDIVCTGAGISHRLAYEEIGPGIGGDIVGLQSLDRYLVVLKDGAVFVINGAFDTSNENSSFTVSRVPGAPGCVGVQASAVGAFGVAYMSQRGLMIYDGSEVRNVSAGKINDIDFRDLANQYCIVSSVGNRIFVHEAANGDESNQMVYVYDVANDAWSYNKCRRLLSQVVEDTENRRELSVMFDTTNIDLVLANHASEIDETFIVGTESRDIGLTTVTPSMLICTSAIPLGDDVHSMGRPKYVDLEFGGLPLGFTQGYISVTVFVGSRTADFSTDSLPPNPIDLHNYATFTGSYPLDTQLYSGERSVARIRLFPSAGDMDGVGPQYAPSYGAFGFVQVELTTDAFQDVGTPWHLVGLTLHSSPVRKQAGGAV